MKKTIFTLAVILLAGCGAGGSNPANVLPVTQFNQSSNASGALRIAVIGDSISVLEVLPSSPVPCGWFTAGAVCAYSLDGSQSYVAKVAHDNPTYAITNLAVPGSETTVNRTVGSTTYPSMLSRVPMIPPDSQVVIIEGGTNDIATGSRDVSRIDVLVKAVRLQAPSARLVFVGVREFFGCQGANPSIESCMPGAVAAWDAHEQTEGGAFVDLRPAFPAGASAYFPDATHPGQGAVAGIAGLVESDLNHLL